MKHLKRLLVLFSISVAVFSCQKEYSVEKPTGGTSTTQWEFKEGGVQFKGPIDTAAIDTFSTLKVLTINGHSDDGTSQLVLQIYGQDLKVGAYKVPYSALVYSKNGTPIYATDQTATDSFTIYLTKIDTTGVTGTFNGKVLAGTTPKNVVDGKFAASFKSSVVTPPASADSGNVVIWSKAGCGGGTSTTPITVVVNGKSGQITTFTSTEPTTCDPAGSLHYKLPVGSYPWVAKCGTDSVTGIITITKGGCTKTQVDFTKPVTGDYFPLTKNSNWTYLYQNGSAGDTAYTFNPGGTTTLLGNVYVLQTNDYGPTYGKDSVYNRKSGNTYYQYVAATSISDTTNGVITKIQVPAYEFRFLVDNLAAGSTFSDAVTGSVTSGTNTIPVVFNFKSTITEVGASVTVGGTSYTNVIKVKTLTSETIAGVTTPRETTEYWYALNIGAIRFLDYYTDPTFTTPDDVWNLTRYKVF